jgi:chromosome segregation ATPase
MNEKPKTVQEGLRLLADWFNAGAMDDENEIRDDLRKWADELDHLAKENADLREKLATAEHLNHEAVEGAEAVNRELAEKDAEIERLRKLECEAWGLEYCCNGDGCGCMGQPINPPPWLADAWDERNAANERVEQAEADLAEKDAEIARLEAELACAKRELACAKRGILQRDHKIEDLNIFLAGEENERAQAEGQRDAEHSLRVDTQDKLAKENAEKDAEIARLQRLYNEATRHHVAASEAEQKAEAEVARLRNRIQISNEGPDLHRVNDRAVEERDRALAEVARLKGELAKHADVRRDYDAICELILRTGFCGSEFHLNQAAAVERLMEYRKTHLLEGELKAERMDHGLCKTALESKITLLTSAETALEERNKEVARLKGELKDTARKLSHLHSAIAIANNKTIVRITAQYNSLERKREAGEREA